MPATSSEIVSIGAAKPPSWERVKGFIKEKIIDEHSPHAHEKKILDRINTFVEGPDDAVVTNLARRFKPFITEHAYAFGVSQTVGEITAVVGATAGAYILAERALPELRTKRQRVNRKIQSFWRKKTRVQESAARKAVSPYLSAEVRAFNAAVRAVSRGETVKDMLSSGFKPDTDAYREQLRLREAMYDVLITNRRDSLVAKLERSIFFGALDRFIRRVGVDNYFFENVDRIARLGNSKEQGIQWLTLVENLYDRAFPFLKKTGHLSDPNLFAEFWYEIESHLGRFGPIPERKF